MNSDWWLLDAEGNVEQLQRSLIRQSVIAVTMSEVDSLADRETLPTALIIATNSRRTAGKRKLRKAVQYAKSVPTLVVDHSFDPQVAKELASAGVQDYLNMNALTPDRLAASLEFSILRHDHQIECNLSQTNACVSIKSRVRYESMHPTWWILLSVTKLFKCST